MKLRDKLLPTNPEATCRAGKNNIRIAMPRRTVARKLCCKIDEQSGNVSVRSGSRRKANEVLETLCADICFHVTVGDYVIRVC